jgi:hypothetical protein
MENKEVVSIGSKILARVDEEIQKDSISSERWKDYGDYDDFCDWHDSY